MSQFSISKSIDDALQPARETRRDDLGLRYHTFRVLLTEPPDDWQAILTALVDAGWQLQGGPIVLHATDSAPRHVLISMLHADPRPLRIGGHLQIRGSIQGEAELRGEILR